MSPTAIASVGSPSVLALSAGGAASLSGGGTRPDFEGLVRDNFDRVLRHSYRLTGNRADAEDLTQDVFVRAMRALHAFRPGTIEGWLHRITVNAFLDRVRRTQRIRFDALAGDQEARLVSREPGPEEVVLTGGYDEDVSAALASLTPEFRDAVLLCDVEGMSYEEIAERLDIKLGTVRSRIHRGRRQLRLALAHRAPRDSAHAEIPAGEHRAPHALAG